MKIRDTRLSTEVDISESQLGKATSMKLMESHIFDFSVNHHYTFDEPIASYLTRAQRRSDKGLN